MKRNTVSLLALSAAAVLLSAAAMPVAPAAFTFVVAEDGNTARYRVREQLVGLDLPNDAIGETSAVSGSIAFDKSGNVIPEASRIVVGVANLKSDRDRRDGYVRRRVLVTDSFPNVELVVTKVTGIRLPVPESGKRSFTLDGNLTVRGVTRATRWVVNADFTDSVTTGKASTKFTFADFGLTKPRVPVVLSVADTIGLEYDFKLRNKR